MTTPGSRDSEGLSMFSLGPFAGATLRYEKTKYGTTLHGDPRCSFYGSDSAATKEFPQPTTGNLSDLVLPPNAHCHFTDRQRAYRNCAITLRDLLRNISDGDEALQDGRLPLELLTNECVESLLAELTEEDRVAMRPFHSEAQSAREALRTKARESLYSTGAHLERVTVVRHLAAGRLAREYSGLYQSYLDAAGRLLRRNDLIDNYPLLKQLFPRYLELAETKTDERQLVAQLATEFRIKLDPLLIERTILAETIGLWESMLASLSSAHRQAFFAVYEYEPTTFDIPSLPDIFLSLWGGNLFSYIGTVWAVSRTSRSFSLHTHGEPTQSLGMTLPWIDWPPAASANLIRSALASLRPGVPAIAVQVIEPGESFKLAYDHSEPRPTPGQISELFAALYNA